MTSHGSRLRQNADQALESVRKTRRIGLIVSVVAMGIVWLIVGALERSGRPFEPFFVLPFVGIATAMMGRAVAAKCPECAKNFYGHPIRAFFASSCFHCGLGAKS